MPKKRVAMHNLGCKVNAYEFDAMRQMLIENGYHLVGFDETADIYIVNTCTVTNIADRKSRQMLHRAKKQNPGAIVVAVGCYVQANGAKDDAIDLAIGNNRKKDIVLLLEEFLATGRAGGDGVIDIAHAKQYEKMRLSHTAGHTRAYIKIQDGCNQFCSYCIIPHVRGRVRSRQQEDIIEEVQTLAAKGCQEAVLTGIHISSYENGLLSLIERIHGIKGIKRIRLGSLEPGIVTKEFAGGLSALSKVCPHFHLSLQSGCDETLKRMNRRYTSSEYYEKVQILREYFQNPAVTTDVIVGFPGESEEEFAACAQFVERVNFYEMHIFKYSRRRGTPAAGMPGQIDEKTKAQRSARLFAIGQRASKQYRESFLGQEVSVLLEEGKTIGGVRYMVGHTREYVKAALLTTREMGNVLLSGTASKMLTDDTVLLSSTENH